MLRSLTLPASWRAVLDTFRPAFRRSSTFAVFALLATGLVAQAGPRQPDPIGVPGVAEEEPARGVKRHRRGHADEHAHHGAA